MPLSIVTASCNERAAGCVDGMTWYLSVHRAVACEGALFGLQAVAWRSRERAASAAFHRAGAMGKTNSDPLHLVR